MKKVIAVAVVAVLVAGSSAIGQITEGQNWNLGLTDNITLYGGPSSAETIQGIGTLNIQSMGINPDMGGDPTVTAGEGVAAALFQTGAAETSGANVGLVQNLLVTGGTLNGQQQAIGDLAGPAMQTQSAALTGSQTLTKGMGSNAVAEGLNLAGFGMGQTFENNCAQGCGLSLILGGQASCIEGAAQAVATVATTMTASVVQVQSANTPEP
ncbi:MAG: hypothetical protein JW955_22970 [Sedimentisphaerales bacterium]|nr:hypothetical protein [Sedimentisphaerales bacterium]